MEIYFRNVIFKRKDMEETKEIKINIPEGYEIDKENSTFECIRFKKKDDTYRHKCQSFEGYYVIRTAYGQAYKLDRSMYENYHLDEIFLFNTEKQAKSAVAMSKISQIMANDERFGGPVTDKEWCMSDFYKYIIYRSGGNIITCNTISREYYLLAFHTKEQRDLFLDENEDLVKDYLMIE